MKRIIGVLLAIALLANFAGVAYQVLSIPRLDQPYAYRRFRPQLELIIRGCNKSPEMTRRKL